MNPWAAAGARLASGGILVLSGFLKLMVPPEEFALALESYQLLPLPAVMQLARFLPWVELLVGAFLILGYAQKISAGSSAALFAAFLGALASTRLRGLDVQDCGCFGRIGPHLGFPQMMLLDACLLGLSLLVFFDKERRFTLDRWLASSSGRSSK